MVPGNKFVVVSMGLCRGYGGGEKWVMGLKDAKKVKEISQLIAKTFSCMALRKIPRKKMKTTTHAYKSCNHCQFSPRKTCQPS